MFIILLPELGRDRLPKTHGQRGWLGYYVGQSVEVGMVGVDDGDQFIFRKI